MRITAVFLLIKILAMVMKILAMLKKILALLVGVRGQYWLFR